MGTYVRGNDVVIVNKFYSFDPVTEATALKNPTTVVFTVVEPDGTTVAYVWGVDANVTNPSVGLFLCALSAPFPPGIHSWEAEGGGVVIATNGGTFEILESGVITGPPQTVADYGPCQPWISAAEVLAMCGATPIDDADAWKYDTAASIGSSVMWDLTGRQFDGHCQRTIRPCVDRCGCFARGGIYGFGPWFGYGMGYPLSPSGAFWFNECGDSCGCGVVPTVRLAGYPVREILEVKIGGDVIDPTTYRLDRRRELVRLSSAGPPRVERVWPRCQDLTLPDTAPGTFSVRYAWGALPPELAKQAASQLGCEVYNALVGSDCRLPGKATKVVRQGITIERAASFAAMFRSGSTGLPLVDLAIASYNEKGMRRRPAVFSPDLQRFGREAY